MMLLIMQDTLYILIRKFVLNVQQIAIFVLLMMRKKNLLVLPKVVIMVIIIKLQLKDLVHVLNVQENLYQDVLDQVVISSLNVILDITVMLIDKNYLDKKKPFHM